MHVRVPQVKKCCCCFPLRQGVILFGFFNVIFSLVAVSCLVITTELKDVNSDGTTLETVTATILFSIFGMGLILNILLLVAGFQKDIAMLRLYLYYGIVTTLAALVPIFMLLTRMHVLDVCVALFAICMQWYVIVIVRSEIMKLEESQLSERVRDEVHEVVIDVPDTETLL